MSSDAISYEEASESTRLSASTPQEQVTSRDLNAIFAASESSVTDTMLNLIRTADTKFRVSNIISATNSIEDIVNNLGGYIENTQLVNNIQRTYRTHTSADSVLITRHCMATNITLIHIPNNEFNTVLKSIVLI